jgi:hypothetical protein
MMPLIAEYNPKGVIMVLMIMRRMERATMAMRPGVAKNPPRPAFSGRRGLTRWR